MQRPRTGWRLIELDSLISEEGTFGSLITVRLVLEEDGFGLGFLQPGLGLAQPLLLQDLRLHPPQGCLFSQLLLYLLPIPDPLLLLFLLQDPVLLSLLVDPGFLHIIPVLLVS